MNAKKQVDAYIQEVPLSNLNLDTYYRLFRHVLE